MIGSVSQTRLAFAPVRGAVAPTSQSTEVAGPAESVSLSGAVPEAPAVPTEATAPTARRSGMRLAGMLALGLVGASLLTGCGEGTLPGVPIPGTGSTTQPGQSDGTLPTAETTVERLKVLSTQNKDAYLDLAEANYYTHIFQTISQQQSEAAKPMADLAKEALEKFDHNGDPAAQRDLLRDYLEGISKVEVKGPEAKYRVLAEAGLSIGARFDELAPQSAGGFLAQAKEKAYQEALLHVDKLPEQVKQNPKIDYEVVRTYAEALAESTKLVDASAKELPEVGARVALYDSVTTELYNRISQDSETLGGEFLKYLQIARDLSGSLLK